MHHTNIESPNAHLPRNVFVQLIIIQVSVLLRIELMGRRVRTQVKGVVLRGKLHAKARLRSCLVHQLLLGLHN